MILLNYVQAYLTKREEQLVILLVPYKLIVHEMEAGRIQQNV